MDGEVRSPDLLIYSQFAQNAGGIEAIPDSKTFPTHVSHQLVATGPQVGWKTIFPQHPRLVMPTWQNILAFQAHLSFQGNSLTLKRLTIRAVLVLVLVLVSKTF